MPYLDDSSIHQQMVRFAATRIREGHLPLTSWFPYLGLGSPQFLHYQSLPSMTAGLIGTVVDPDTVFRWSIYLLLALWPLAVYWGGRLFGLSRWTAASAAAVSPFLASAAGIGYETKAYVWVGYGVWTQLWASWTPPLAWGFTYRALSVAALRTARRPLHHGDGRAALRDRLPGLRPARGVAVHRPRRTCGAGWAVRSSWARPRLLASAWVIVPLLDQSHWAARNQVLEGTGLENGYGARQILSWLFTGNLYDNGPRWPVVTVLVGVGIGVCIWRWRSHMAGRALRDDLGGHAADDVRADDVRRALRHRARAAVTSSSGASRWACSSRASCWPASASSSWDGSCSTPRCVCFPEDRRGWAAEPAGRGIVAGLCIVALVLVLAPAWTAHGHLRRAQRHQHRAPGGADAQQEPSIDQLLAYVRAHPQGRVYAGQPTNWGNDFLVGAVPVFKYLESKDIDEVGYTLRTASLMTDPEYFFDDTNPGDYPLFGIGYIITPERHGAAGAGRQGRLCRATTACGRSPTRATSTSTTRPACSRPRGPTSARRARPCSTPRSSASNAT